VKLKDFWVLELFHGPTFAFKDIALQFLGNLFEFFLHRGKVQSSLTVLGATSGDTGSAAIHGLRGKAHINCFILFPFRKVTEVQERQMTTVPDENVHCISIKGDFDDAQSIVKQAFADRDFRDEVKLGAINSINWARILAQITYYFYSWLRVTDGLMEKEKDPRLSFAVPTGNFGDILAGYYAKRMGLPIDRLVVCTNENAVLHRFFETGSYKRQTALNTIAPSMDISVSSNFERYLYYLAEEDGPTLATWMNIFEENGELNLSADLLETAKQDFSSHSADKAAIVNSVRHVFKHEQYLVCPHTATAVSAVHALQLRASHTVILATAHPAKFEEAIALALPLEELPRRPIELQELFSRPTRVTCMPTALQSVQDFIRACLDTSNGTSRKTISCKKWTKEKDELKEDSLGVQWGSLVLFGGLLATAVYIFSKYNRK
jgi:threonine synthase